MDLQSLGVNLEDLGVNLKDFATGATLQCRKYKKTNKKSNNTGDGRNPASPGIFEPSK